MAILVTFLSQCKVDLTGGIFDVTDVTKLLEVVIQQWTLQLLILSYLVIVGGGGGGSKKISR